MYEMQAACWSTDCRAYKPESSKEVAAQYSVGDIVLATNPYDDIEGRRYTVVIQSVVEGTDAESVGYIVAERNNRANQWIVISSELTSLNL